jgi:LacI family transcriptional regulator
MATIKDVARHAGVGVGTASRVVSGKGPVAPATLERVQKAIKELDFRPSHAARALLKGSSQMVGVYIPMLKGTFYTPILQAIDTRLRNAGVNMVVAFGVGSGDARRQACEGIAFLMDRGVDGLIALTHHLQDEDIAALGLKQTNVVLMNHHLSTISEQCFSVDHAQGGRLAARTLLERGHRKIAVIGGPWSAPDNVARITSFMGELEGAGIDPASVWYGASDFSPEGGWTQAGRLLESDYRFTALFCANDEMAVGAMSRLNEHGLRVPADVAVLGYDDSPAAEYSTPRLTSVHIPWVEIVMNGLNELLNRCYGTQLPVERGYVIRLAERASLGQPIAGLART